MALPPISGSPTPSIQPVSGSRAEAQRAFFDAALKRNKAPAAPTAAAAPRAATPAMAAASPQPTRPSASIAQISDEPPARLPRPGSRVNILV